MPTEFANARYSGSSTIGVAMMLSFVPAVARYSSDASAIARKLAVMLARLVHHQSLTVRHDRLMPRFVTGQSIGPPPVPRGA
jgi:hypothetical protein